MRELRRLENANRVPLPLLACVQEPLGIAAAPSYTTVDRISCVLRYIDRHTENRGIKVYEGRKVLRYTTFWQLANIVFFPG